MKANSKKEDTTGTLEFYIDYYGNYLKTNGKQYAASQVKKIKRLKTSSNIVVEAFQIELENGKKGKVSINPRAAHYKAAISFIQKCYEQLGLDF